MKHRIRKILRELYSPAGKQIKPDKFVFHKSSPKFRKKISKMGLIASVGDCYKEYVGKECEPAIFATNTTHTNLWFWTGFDDDVWQINTKKIPNVIWFRDDHFDDQWDHIVTFQDIPPSALTLVYKGTGKEND